MAALSHQASMAGSGDASVRISSPQPEGMAFLALRQGPGVHAAAQPSAVFLRAARVLASMSSV
jgi:hypothetical protein